MPVDTAQEPDARAKPRPEARDSAPIGSAHGVHMPGILPEPDVIVPEGEELTNSEREVLRDLETALPESDRSSADEATATTAPPVELPRQRAQFPWWYGAVFFLLSGSMLVASAWFAAHSVAVRTAYLVVGVVCLCFALKAWNARKQPRGPG